MMENKAMKYIGIISTVIGLMISIYLLLAKAKLVSTEYVFVMEIILLFDIGLHLVDSMIRACRKK